MVGGIVLAAGASSRMGRTKALLPSGDGRSFLGRIVASLLEGGVDEVAVVAGRDAASVERHAASASLAAVVVRNLEPERGQLSSLLVALDTFSDLPLEAVVVLPVDLPLVSAATVRRVLDAWRSARPSIARPARGDGRHGHPVVFAARLFPDLRAADPSVGARQVLRSRAAEILDVPVDDPGAFEDIDTPDDYERLIGAYPRP